MSNEYENMKRIVEEVDPKCLSFGDIIVNENASKYNPQKVLMVVSHRNNIKCLSTTGEEVIFSRFSKTSLKKVGAINFHEWFKIVLKYRDISLGG